MFYPCYEYCYLRLGKQYNNDCIKQCDYAKTINILKKILITNDGCYTHCKHLYYEKNIGTACDFENKCKNHSMYEIDYDKLNKDYNIN